MLIEALTQRTGKPYRRRRALAQRAPKSKTLPCQGKEGSLLAKWVRLEDTLNETKGGMSMDKLKPDREDRPPPGHRWVYTPYVIRKGKVIYPKNAKVFRILVKI